GVTALRQLLRHPDTYVRAAAAEQLGYEARRDDAIVPDLVALLKDSNLVVRGRALTALGTAGTNAGSAAELVAVYLKDRHPEIRLRAAATLPRIGATAGRAEAVEVARTALADRQGHGGGLTTAALLALGGLG